MVISPRQDLDSVDTQAMSHNRAITPECRSASVNTHNMTISVQTTLFINQNQQTDLTGLGETKSYYIISLVIQTVVCLQSNNIFCLPFVKLERGCEDWQKEMSYEESSMFIML